MAGIDMTKVDVVGLPTGRHESFAAFVATTGTTTMALTARPTALEHKTEQRHEQMQTTLGQISNGMQGTMLASEQYTSLTMQMGAGCMALASHVNAGNAAFTASGVTNLPAPLPAQEQVSRWRLCQRRRHRRHRRQVLRWGLQECCMALVTRMMRRLRRAHRLGFHARKRGAPLRVPSTAMALTTI